MPELIVSLVVFYALHSLLAWSGVKRWASEHLGLERWYRLTYTIASLALAGWVYMAYTGAPDVQLFLLDLVPLRYVCRVLVAAGSLVAAAAVLRFGGTGFIGLTRERDPGLVRTGLHGHVRHPIYSGVLLMAIGWLLLDGGLAALLVVSITFLYLPIGIHLEERKLIARYGDAYLRYRREVPALMPRLRV